MVLHTHQGNPRVHLVVKSVREQGVRFNIRKATLRDRRQQFATCLRQHGIEANATERAVRGEIRTRKSDAIYRSDQRGASAHIRARMDAVAHLVRSGRGESETGRSTLIETRRQVERGWYAVHDLFERHGHAEVARDIRRFVAQMQSARTERGQIAEAFSAGLSSGRKYHEPRSR
jgi:hypothetical protein